jgi:hypothetical protein
VPLISGWLDDMIDIFAYFNNNVGGYAPRDEQALPALLDG